MWHRRNSENDITPTLDDYSNISAVTVEFSGARRISEVKNLLFDNDFFFYSVSQTN